MDDSSLILKPDELGNHSLAPQNQKGEWLVKICFMGYFGLFVVGTEAIASCPVCGQYLTM